MRVALKRIVKNRNNDKQDADLRRKVLADVQHKQQDLARSDFRQARQSRNRFNVFLIAKVSDDNQLDQRLGQILQCSQTEHLLKAVQRIEFFEIRLDRSRRKEQSDLDDVADDADHDRNQHERPRHDKNHQNCLKRNFSQASDHLIGICQHLKIIDKIRREVVYGKFAKWNK